jgi:hypothetical protein
MIVLYIKDDLCGFSTVLAISFEVCSNKPCLIIYAKDCFLDFIVLYFFFTPRTCMTTSLLDHACLAQGSFSMAFAGVLLVLCSCFTLSRGDLEAARRGMSGSRRPEYLGK